MPLNLEPRNAEFTPYVKFNGKAGRWYTKTEAGEEVEVKNMTAIFDLANIKTGWIHFVEGGAPEQTWDNGSMAAQPSPQHRRGFAVLVFSPKEIGGLRELSSTSNVSIIAIKELHAAFEDAPEASRGDLVPVVTCESVVPVKSKFGTNYQPILKITKWVPQPEALRAATAASGSPRAEPSHDVPPPISGTIGTSDSADSEEF